MPFGHPIKGDPCGGGGSGGAGIHVGDQPPADTSLVWANTADVPDCGWVQVPMYVYIPCVGWAVYTVDGLNVLTVDGLQVQVQPS